MSDSTVLRLDQRLIPLYVVGNGIPHCFTSCAGDKGIQLIDSNADSSDLMESEYLEAFTRSSIFQYLILDSKDCDCFCKFCPISARGVS